MDKRSLGVHSEESESLSGMIRDISKRIRFEPFLFVLAMAVVLIPISKWSSEVAAYVALLTVVGLGLYIGSEIVIRGRRVQAEEASRKRANYFQAGKNADRFWRSFSEGPVRIVIGRFLDEFKQFEQTGLLGVGDAIAMSELTSFLESVGVREHAVHYADLLDGSLLGSNLIVLGGPDANLLTRDIMSRIESSLRPGDHEIYDVSLNDTKAKKIFVPRSGSDGNLLNDYAIVAKNRNPYNASKQILVIFGCFGYGTWAGVRFVTSEEGLGALAALPSRTMECLVEADIVRQSPQNIRMHVARSL